MYDKVFINDFVTLGKLVAPALSETGEYPVNEETFRLSQADNQFFTREMQLYALDAVCRKFLSENELVNWIKSFPVQPVERDEEAGIIMAGNIPLVGFHDLLCVLACGLKAAVKFSSKDKYLPAAILEILFGINPYWRNRITVADNIPGNIPLLLASGSDYSVTQISALYPAARKLLRGSRSSVAILKGDEDKEELCGLAADVFTYFGFGCRSVSTLLVSENYDVMKLRRPFSEWRDRMMESRGWSSSYRQMKAVLTLNSTHFYDFDFCLLAEFGKFPPPNGCLNLYSYSDVGDIQKFLNENNARLQAICESGGGVGRVSPGRMQYPALNDYADGVDVPVFLLNNFM
jgi:hypothetical protein